MGTTVDRVEVARNFKGLDVSVKELIRFGGAGLEIWARFGETHRFAWRD
jgi:hypothetical protein